MTTPKIIWAEGNGKYQSSFPMHINGTPYVLKSIADNIAESLEKSINAMRNLSVDGYGGGNVIDEAETALNEYRKLIDGK